MLLAAVSAMPAVDAGAQNAGPGIVEFIDVQEREAYVDVTIQFACPIRYVAHSPANEGRELRVRLRAGPDCTRADMSTTTLPIAGATGVLASAAVEVLLPAEPALVLTWAQPEVFVLAQGASSSGLRVRLLRRHEPKPRVYVGERASLPQRFAINLESRRQPFAVAEVIEAAERLGQPTFVSQVQLGNETWHRLRAGPFERRADAERLTLIAAKLYPQAWLAIGDDAAIEEAPSLRQPELLPAVEQAGADALLDAATREKLLRDAQRALRTRKYDDAVRLLTRLQRQPEFDERAQAQELLGLARERAGQLAHAKAEYEEYLRRYPAGGAANRVRARLAFLRAASAPSGRRPLAGADGGWRASGAVAQLYRHDAYESTANATTDAQVDSFDRGVLLNDVDFMMRYRGERVDFATRVNGGYAYNVGDGAGGNETRVSTAYLELNDQVRGIGGRLGRHSRSTAGVPGSFDGASVHYRLRSAWTIESVVGMPVDSSRESPDTQRRLASLAVQFSPEGSAWSVSGYATEQRTEGIDDRRAVGVDFGYFDAGRSLVGLIDYDVGFQSLSGAFLAGAFTLPDRWQASFNLEQRSSPLLSVRNALMGQQVTSLADLEQAMGEDAVRDLALDRTGSVSSGTLSVGRPMGERFHFSADVVGTRHGATEASGGVAAQPSTRLELGGQLQLSGYNLFRYGDFNIVALRYEDQAAGRIASAGFVSRFPIRGGWRIGTRLRAEQHQLANGTTRAFYMPSLRIDYQRGGRLFELDVGAELGDAGTGTGDRRESTRAYASIGYRWGF